MPQTITNVNCRPGSQVINITNNIDYGDATLTLTGDVVGPISANTIAPGVITDAKINAAANIADLKLATITTPGKIADSATSATSNATPYSIAYRDSTGSFDAVAIYSDLDTTTEKQILNVGVNNATIINIGTSSTTQVVNVGTGTRVTTINLGGMGDMVNIVGTLTYINTTNTDITNASITLNKGGAANSAEGSGLVIKEASINTGYAQIANTEQSWAFKAPANAGFATITLPSTGSFDINQRSHNPIMLGASTNGLALTGQQLSLGTASASTTGALLSTDWTTFNNTTTTVNAATSAPTPSTLVLRDAMGASSFNKVTTANISNTSDINCQIAGAFNLKTSPLTNVQTIQLGSGSGTGWSAEKMTIRMANLTGSSRISMGKNANELEIGVIGTAGDYLTGSLQGDVTIRNVVASQASNRILLGIGTAPILTINPTGTSITGTQSVSSDFTCLDTITNAGITSGGSLHFTMRSNNTTRYGHGLYDVESGSNTGSDYALWRYNDDGSFLGLVYLISRASGSMFISSGLTTNGNIAFSGLTTITGATSITGATTIAGNTSITGNETIVGAWMQQRPPSNMYTLLPGTKTSLTSNSFIGGETLSQPIFTLTTTGTANGCVVDGCISITNNPNFTSGAVQNYAVKFTMAYAQGTVNITQTVTSAATSLVSNTLNISLTFVSNQLVLGVTSSTPVTLSILELCWDAFYDVIVNQNQSTESGSGTGTVFTITTFTHT